jgi:hypothetical protein
LSRLSDIELVGPCHARAARAARRRSSAEASVASGSCGEPDAAVAQLVHPLAELGARGHREVELASCRAQRLVDARQHPPQTVAAVGGEQLEPLADRLRRRTRPRPSPTPPSGAPAACASSSSRKRGSSPAASGYARSRRAAEAVDRRDPAPSSSRARSCRPRSARRCRIRVAALPRRGACT